MEQTVSESSAQADLDRFRDEWLSEVARNKRPGRNVGVGRFDDSALSRRKKNAPILPSVTSSSAQNNDFSEDVSSEYVTWTHLLLKKRRRHHQLKRKTWGFPFHRRIFSSCPFKLVRR